MRIAFFTEVFLPKIDGVVTRLTRTLEQLSDMGHEAIIFAPGNPPKTFAGFEVVAIPSLSLWPVYPEIKWGLPSLRVFAKVREFDPDIIHALNPIWTAALGVFAAKRDDYPLVASYHTNVPDYVDALGIGWTRPLTNWAIKTFHGQARLNLCTSGPMLDKARELGLPHLALWPKAVDTQGYHPRFFSTSMRVNLSGNHPDSPLVTYIGRVSKEKDLDRLDSIMTEVRKSLPGARLAIVGGGPYAETLEQKFDTEYTEFTGFLSGEKLSQAFASGDVFIFPSTTETLGLVALESFASGVPVVGARAGGIPFVIDDGVTGYLIDPDSSDQQWAEAISSLLSDKDLRLSMGDSARKEAEKHSWAQSTSALIDAYKKVLRDEAI